MPRIIAPDEYWGTGQLNPAQFSPMDILSAEIRGKTAEVDELMRLMEVDLRVRELLEQSGCSVVPRSEIDGGFGDDDYILYDPIDKAGQLDAIQRELPDIPMPRTVGFAEFRDAPFYPVVVKHVAGEAGLFQFLLERKEQWLKFERFVAAGASMGDDEMKTVPVTEDSYQFQEFIQTPSDRYTSYRVLASYTGEILASGLFYSRHKKGEKKHHKKFADMVDTHDLLLVPGMPPFLDATDHRSNLATAGMCLPLTRDFFSDDQRAIFGAHNIDFKQPELPEHVREHAQQIARTFGRRWGALLAMDFIQSSDGRTFYLETNPSGDAVLFYRMHQDKYRNKVESHIDLYAKVFAELIGESQTD